MGLSPNAVTTLEARYLLRDEKGTLIEVPDELFDRVANAISAQEKDMFWYTRFYRLMVPKHGGTADFLPNTPTLMNAGKENGQLSACFVLPIEDQLVGGTASIFRTLENAAAIHQSGGGTGFDFSRLRPKGAMVSSKAGVSSGPISFASIYNKATEEIKQGASRRGANMMNLRVDHPDIWEFIDMKATGDNEVMKNFNVSVTITDEFMEALNAGKNYALTHPITGITRWVSASAIWNRIAENAWRSAEPGIIFIDRVNSRSPYWERIEATNPCGEQPLPPYGSCNLGSINLSNFIFNSFSGPAVDWTRLADVTCDAVRFLDNVIDANVYPTPELEAHAQKYRNIGLGVMGWADALIKLKIPYTSEEAVDLGRAVMQFINETSHAYSVELAKEKGIPSGAPFKTFYDYSSPERRNATLTTVAPTGSLCILANCSSGVEPNFAFALEKHVLEQVLVEYHPLYEAAKNNGGVDKTVFIEAHDVTGLQHVDMQAAFQEHCDSAISKTINLPNTATIEDVKSAYRRAWETGCKGITVYRDGSRAGVLHRKTDEGAEEASVCSECGGEIEVVQGCETCLSCGLSKCLIA